MTDEAPPKSRVFRTIPPPPSDRNLRILLIHTGGTLMMRGDDVTPLSPDVYTRDLLAELPALAAVGDIETRILFGLDSSDMQPHHWVELAEEVHSALPDYDGVVIVHGTDTMAYTASALAFLLPGLDKPVVITGSQNPLADIRSDARANLVDACAVIALGIPEVGIMFRSQLLRGCRARKTDAWSLQAFRTPAIHPLAELGTTVMVGTHVLRREPSSMALFDPRIEPRVLAVRVFPGLDPALLHGAIAAGMRGLVIEAFGAGNVPHLEKSLVPVIESARKLDVPIVVVSQCERGAVDLTRYAGGADAAKAGAIGAGDMTPEAALTKLMVVLGRVGQGGRVRAAREAFATDFAGEVSWAR